jgi:hypothetical protein
MTAVRIYGHCFPVYRMASDMAGDCSGVFFQVAPAYGDVFPVGGLVEKLKCQMGFGFFGLGNNQKAGSVFVDTVHQTGPEVVPLE